MNFSSSSFRRSLRQTSHRHSSQPEGCCGVARSSSLNWAKIFRRTLSALRLRKPLYVKKTFLLYKARALQSTAKLVSVSNSKKEVFQPHLPVRLPCYDLAPVTSFALGRSSRSRTSGTPGFHGLTGGVYKARERIHRAMADARLLANPTSWSRVADSNPNWDGFSRSASCRQVASLCTHHCNTCVAPDVRAVLI